MTVIAVSKVVDQSQPAAPAEEGHAAGNQTSLARDARTIQLALETNLRSVHDLVEDLRNSEAPTSDPLKLPEAVEAKAAAKPAATKTSTSSRWLKIALGVALVVGLGWSPLKSMLAATSAEAVINARVITIRSPIEGTVDAAPDVRKSWSAQTGAPLLHIVDEQANPAHLDDLRRQFGALEDQARSLASQSALDANALLALAVQVERFRHSRLEQLNARVKASEADLAAASARATQSASARKRSDELRKSGVTSAAESDKVQSDWIAATNAEAGAARRLEEVSIERDAAANGVFIGDSYNDTPNSSQRADELRLRIGELDAQIVATRSQMKRLSSEILTEEMRFHDRSDVLAAFPASGRVWEMLTARGEHVARGQDLMRVLDCANPIVSANVDENVYDRLELGGAATFQLAQSGGKTYRGVVVNLTGPAGAPANFAIPPAAMRTSGFFATVAIDGIGDSGCEVGRTGTVTFAPRGGEVGSSPVGLRP